MSSLDFEKSKHSCITFQKAEAAGTLKFVEEIHLGKTTQGQTIETFIEFLQGKIEQYSGTQLYLDVGVSELCRGFDLVEVLDTSTGKGIER